eukprot:COSAG06_NODE_4426_length_4278_cov_26.527638_7_plen_180_part_00
MCAADLDSSGMVQVGDLLLLLAAYGYPCTRPDPELELDTSVTPVAMTPPVAPEVAARQFAVFEAAAAAQPATPMVSVASQISFAAEIDVFAHATPEREAFEVAFRHSLAGSLGDGTTVRPDTVFVDDITEAAAMQATMFGAPAPPRQLNPLAPLLPAVRVHFHITVPDGLQTTTVSLIE